MEGLGENPKEVTVLPYSQTVISLMIHMAALLCLTRASTFLVGAQKDGEWEVVRSPRVRGSEHRNNLLSIPWCVKIELDFN